MGLLTAAELAEAISVSVKTVYRLTASEVIPSLRVGRHHRYDLDAVKAALAPAPKVPASWAQPARSANRKRVA